MTVVLVESGKDARIANINSDLKSMQKIVGGLIEIISLEDYSGNPKHKGILLVCNEEGKLNHLPITAFLYDERTETVLDFVAGNFFLCREDKEGNLISLTLNDAREVVDYFSK